MTRRTAGTGRSKAAGEGAEAAAPPGAGRAAIEIDLDIHRAIERARIALGESANDILRRLLLPGPPGRARPRGGRPGPRGAAPGTRSRGLWSLEIGGRSIGAANLKSAYRLLLRELHAAHPHFLAGFAQEWTGGRRFVARTPAELYARSPHLARHAELLADGWYFDANLSETQVARRARIAARLCGLFYGQDLRILDNFREI